MGKLRRIVGRRAWTLACIYSLVSAVAHAAEDPSLQLYLDFETFEPDPARKAWVLNDRSVNRSDILITNTGNALALARTTELGHALHSVHHNTGFIAKEDVLLYALGEGLTVSVWARGRGLLKALFVGPVDFINGDPLLQVLIVFGDTGFGVGWQAVQTDGVSVAFDSSALSDGTSEWVHFAAVYDPAADLALIYLNGEEVAREDTDGEVIAEWGVPPASSVVFDLWPDNRPLPQEHGIDPIIGLYMDELRVYARALSRDEIGAVMWTGSPLGVFPHAGLTTTWGALKER
jgi:hypothetical protein